MKKPVLLLMVTLLSGVPCLLSAQQNKWHIGIEAGPARSTIYGYSMPAPLKREPLYNISGGLSLQYNFPKVISLKTGLYFEQKGFKTGGEVTDASGQTAGKFHTKHTLDYISLPLLMRATFGKKINCFVNAGGFAGYLVNASTESSYLDLRSKDNISDWHHAYDLGISFGGGVSAPIGKNLLVSLEARNNLGLINTSALPVYNNGAIKTNVSSLLIGIAYRIGTRTS